MNLKAIMKRIMYRERASSETYVAHLKKIGVRIGEEAYFYAPRSTEIDETRPYLVEIGNNVHFAPHVIVLTHDYGWTVLRGIYHEMVGSGDKVTIKDNVFIGLRTTILKGVTIGENSIVGANSLVTKDVPSNSVVAGVPAKVICSIDEYWRKRRVERAKEAMTVAVEYKKVYGSYPPVEEMFEFFWVFEERKEGMEPGYSHPSFDRLLKKRKVYPELLVRYHATKAIYPGYEAFLKACETESQR